ncbi:MAG TPA: SRPBCC family protein [Steroidobacteraceae bacterium]|nr:SRPBCC family protein [Steroidobacteraceae bacterium]
MPERSRLFDENWPPAFRLLAVLSSGALLLYGARQRGLLGLAAAAAGGVLAVRSATNTPIERLAGAQGRRGIDIRKTIHVEAPVERVFATLANYENFPAFMRNVRDVTLHPDGRSHWVVAGPAGFSVEWDAETSVSRPNELLGWRTVRSATVQHAGLIRFRPQGAGTQLDVRMTYNPPAGALGHIVAKLFGADAKTELEEDLVRLKTFLETGAAPRDAAAHSIETRQRSEPTGSARVTH